MNKSDVLGFAKKVIPWIGAAATGNVPALVAMAASAVSGALGVEVMPEPDAVSKAIAGATPEQLLALKNAEYDFQLKMREWGYKELIDFEAMVYADIANARSRDVEITKATGHANVRAHGLVIGAWILVLICMAVTVWSSTMDDFAKGIITLILGRSLGWVEQIFSFEFGTTRASKGKDDTIKSLSEK